MPLEEYLQIGQFFGYLISTFRLSLGDSDFAASLHLDFYENIIFWIIWVLTVYLTCIVFLNFIIAEVSNSYSDIKVRLAAIQQKEKASLITEAEDMTFDSHKTEELFPKYIIIRNIET